MEGEKKLRNNKRFRLIFYPIAGFLLVVTIVAAILLNVFEQSLDWFFGRGDVVVLGDDKDVNTKYYNPKFDTTAKGREAAQLNGFNVTEEICDQGDVLLKNDGVLPLAKKSKVTPFGFRYQQPIYGGVGSGAIVVSDYFTELKEAMNEYFDINTTMESNLSKAQVKYIASDGYHNSNGNTGDYDGGTVMIGEFEPSIYKSSDVGDHKTGIVFLGREAGEGNDLQNSVYADGTKHQLQLCKYEKEMVDFAKANCDKVIMIINSSNALELTDYQNDDKINAILWVGQPGSSGFKSMAKILTGEVNPSGKTVDLWAVDATSHPSVKNIGDHTYSNANVKYVEYEEGIYIGYRYFETASKMGSINYDNAVLYPFGYGLNYDDDKVSQTLDSVVYKDNKITVKGKVTNTSSNYDVDEVVQIYFEAEYNASSKIEKSSKVLVAFDKVHVKKGETINFEISFDDEQMASYDYKGYYSDNGCYVLESSEYRIVLGKDSHNEWDSKTINIDKTSAYTTKTVKNGAKAVGKRTTDKKEVNNLYLESNQYMNSTDCVNMSRADFNSTFPTTSDGKLMPDVNLNNYNACNNGTLSYKDKLEEKWGKEKPKSNAKNNLKLSEFRGLDYDDPQWEKLLDQLSYTGAESTQLKSLIGKAAYSTGKLDAIGKPETTDVDGPQGLSKVSPVNAYMAEAVLGSTWNVDLARKMGEAIGNEFLAHTRVGWYAPAMNIHRSPFAGRNYEYYAEDPLLSGKMAASEVSAAGEKGVVSYIKHFAVNDQETNRKKITTWANEQTMREIYFKPFEICVKEAECEIKYNERDYSGNITFKSKKIKATLGVMSSMNAIGSTFACMDYRLQQEMLRDEWGFNGSILTDSLDTSWDIDCAVAGGTNLWLWYIRNDFKDTESAYMQHAIRDAVHHIGYAYANSLIMQGVAPGVSVRYRTSPWRYVEALVLLILCLGLDVIVGFAIYREIDERRHPERYLHKAKKEENK